MIKKKNSTFTAFYSVLQHFTANSKKNPSHKEIFGLKIFLGHLKAALQTGPLMQPREEDKISATALELCFTLKKIRYIADNLNTKQALRFKENSGSLLWFPNEN